MARRLVLYIFRLLLLPLPTAQVRLLLGAVMDVVFEIPADLNQLGDAVQGLVIQIVGRSHQAVVDNPKDGEDTGAMMLRVRDEMIERVEGLVSNLKDRDVRVLARAMLFDRVIAHEEELLMTFLEDPDDPGSF